MANDETKITCYTPTPGKQPTRIDRWKYDLIRKAILDSIPEGDIEVPFNNLAAMIAKRLSSEETARLGSVSWYTTTVKLDMEVKGEIERIPGSDPQRLRRTK